MAPHPDGGEPLICNPRMVTLARQARGLTQSQLATKIATIQATVSKMEAGVISISETDRESIGAALDFPPAFFTSENRVEGPGIPEFLHRKKAKASVTALHQIHAIATVRQMHVNLLLMSWEQHRQFPSFPIEDHDADPRRIAQTVRAALKIPPGPIFSMTELVEEAGAIVIDCKFTTRDIDAFSRCTDDDPPLIYINDAIPPDRWRWTLAHELGHLVMHPHSDPYPEMEKDANIFASELLLPAQEIGPQLTKVTLGHLAGLKRYWKVSMQAILMRAHDLKRVTANQKRYLFMQLSKAGYRMREPATLDPPAEPPQLLSRIVDYHRHDLGYSISDLCSALRISEGDLRAWYLPDQPRLFAVN